MKLLQKQPAEVWGGLECTVNRVNDNYFDQLVPVGHRERDGDIRLFAGLGIKKIRYPIIWEHHEPVQNQKIDWTVTGQKINELRLNGIDVIAGLVHHGSGPVYAGIQSEHFESGLAAFAGKVAEKFPWINFYTPVNEPLTTARFCGLYGVWHPHEKNDFCFCRILVNECKATAMAMVAIRKVNPGAQLIQTDDLAKVHSSPALTYQAEFENERRWLSFDLLCGRVNESHALWEYLLENGISADELAYFRVNPCPPNILGLNYYLTSERYLDDNKQNYPSHTHGGNGKHTYADVEAVRVAKAKPAGLGSLLTEAWQRYRIPMAVTEVHLHCTREEQMRWLYESWLTANRLRDDGIPVIAITPWAMLGSYGWDRLLISANGTYESGVFDCTEGYPRTTALGRMIKSFSENTEFEHPVLSHPGWWQRSCRVTYGERYVDSGSVSGNCLAISGTHAILLAEICQIRGLKTVFLDEVEQDFSVWANIIAGEYLEITRVGRPDLVISLYGELYRDLNAGLDLLLDEESGYWEVGFRGTLIKQPVEVSPIQI